MGKKELLDKVLHQDQEAFNELCRQYYDTILKFVKKVNPKLGDDEVQDTLMEMAKIFKRPEKKFDDQWYKKFTGWLYRVSHNVAHRRLSKDADKRALSLDNLGTYNKQTHAFDMPLLGQKGPQTMAAHNTLRTFIRQRISSLRPIYRDVIAIRMFEGLDYESIGDRLGISSALARKRMQIGLELLERDIRETRSTLVNLYNKAKKDE